MGLNHFYAAILVSLLLILSNNAVGTNGCLRPGDPVKFDIPCVIKTLQEMPRSVKPSDIDSLHGFVVHTNHHLENLFFLLSRIKAYLTNDGGLPEVIDFETGEKHPKIDRKALLMGLGIPSDISSGEIKQLIKFTKAYFRLHDQAKWDTSEPFYHFIDARADAIGISSEERFFIHGIRNEQVPDFFPIMAAGIGLDPWNILHQSVNDPNFNLNNLSAENQALFFFGKTLQRLNLIDSSLGEEFLRKIHEPRWLNDRWVQVFVKTLERNIDSVERSMNPVSPQEFGRTMYRQSKHVVVQGRPTPRRNCDDMFCQLNVRLENDIHSAIEKGKIAYGSYRERVDRFFEVLSDLGLTEDILDPLNKYLLLIIVKQEEQDPKAMHDPVKVADKIFMEYSRFVSEHALNKQNSYAVDTFRAVENEWLKRTKPRFCEVFLRGQNPRTIFERNLQPFSTSRFGAATISPTY